MRSVELDAVVVSDGISDPRVDTLLREAYRHAKAIAAVPGAADVLEAAGVRSADEGVVVEADPAALASALTGALARHRAWDRAVGSPASTSGGPS
jgi:catalase